MSQVIDLTQEIVDRMPVYPGDVDVQLYADDCFAASGITMHRLQTGTHAGTHIDAPLHMLPGGSSLKDIPPSQFVGEGCLIDARGQKKIGMREEYRDLVPPDSIVLILSGHHRFFGGNAYFLQGPVLDVSLAQFLVERRVKLVGIDWASPDQEPYPVHKLLFVHNILIAENLCNLEALLHVSDFQVFALPLHMGTDGAPARVVAQVGGCRIQRSGAE